MGIKQLADKKFDKVTVFDKKNLNPEKIESPESNKKVRRINGHLKDSNSKRKNIDVISNKITKYLVNSPSRSDFIESVSQNLDFSRTFSRESQNFTTDRDCKKLANSKPSNTSKVFGLVRNFEEIAKLENVKGNLRQMKSVISGKDAPICPKVPPEFPIKCFNKISMDSIKSQNLPDQNQESLVRDKTVFPVISKGNENGPKLARKKDWKSSKRVIKGPIDSYFKKEKKTEAVETNGKRKFREKESDQDSKKPKGWESD